jgi:hypothetical protein
VFTILGLSPGLLYSLGLFGFFEPCLAPNMAGSVGQTLSTLSMGIHPISFTKYDKTIY